MVTCFLASGRMRKHLPKYQKKHPKDREHRPKDRKHALWVILWVRKDVSVMGLKMMKRGSVQVKMAAVKALSPKISPLRSASMRRELPESPSSANGESKEPNAASATPAAP